MGNSGLSSRGKAWHQFSLERRTLPGKAGTGLHGYSSAISQITGKPGHAAP